MQYNTLVDIHVLQAAFHDLYALDALHLLVPLHLLSFTPSLAQQFLCLLGEEDERHWKQRATVEQIFYTLYYQHKEAHSSALKEHQAERRSLQRGKFRFFTGFEFVANVVEKKKGLLVDDAAWKRLLGLG